MRERAENGSIAFAGAVLRPHADLMRQGGQLTSDGAAVLDAARQAGRELVQEGTMREETLAAIRQSLISEEALRRMYNQAI